MPDLRYLDCRVDFSIKTFGAVVSLCKDLGIRHPEELSLCKPLEPSHLKRNYADLVSKKNGKNLENVAPDTNTFIPTSNSFHGSDGSLDGPNNGSPFSCAPSPQNYTPIKPGLQSTPISSPTGVSI